MFCNNCGKELPDGSIGCPSCGTRFDKKEDKKLFCSRCGKQLAATAMQCPDCGAPTENAKKPTPAPVRNVVYTQASANDKNNIFAIIGFVMSLTFFVGIASLVCSIIGLCRSKDCNGNESGIAIAGIIVSALSLFVLMIIFIAALSTPTTTPGIKY